MVNTSTAALAALAILLTATTCAAFVQTYRPLVQQKSSSLPNDYLEQLDTQPTSSTSSNAYTDSEKFHRSLLEAKLAYDAIDAALSTTPSSTTTTSTLEDIDFDAPILNNPVSASGPLDHEIIVDDECYMGKDGQLDECADFDPPVVAAVKQSMLKRRAATATEDTDFDAPVLNNPVSASGPLDHEIVVDDECYMGKDGQLDECADFDPPRGVVATKPKVSKPVVTTSEPIKASTSSGAIVPINEATVQFTAGTIGGLAGLIVGGPILGAVSASAFNYLSRKDDRESTATTKKIVDTASESTLQAYNFLAQFEKDNNIIDNVSNLLKKVVDKAKETDTPAGDVLKTLESTLVGVVNKLEEFNDDYDLVGGAGTVLDSVGDLVEIGVDKVVELNDEYKLTNRVGDAVSSGHEKIH